MEKKIVTYIENALARAGYIILDRDGNDSVVFRDKGRDIDYKIKISEIVK